MFLQNRIYYTLCAIERMYTKHNPAQSLEDRDTIGALAAFLNELTSRYETFASIKPTELDNQLLSMVGELRFGDCADIMQEELKDISRLCDALRDDSGWDDPFNAFALRLSGEPYAGYPMLNAFFKGKSKLTTFGCVSNTPVSNKTADGSYALFGSKNRDMVVEEFHRVCPNVRGVFVSAQEALSEVSPFNVDARPFLHYPYKTEEYIDSIIDSAAHTLMTDSPAMLFRRYKLGIGVSQSMFGQTNSLTQNGFGTVRAMNLK